MGRVEAEAGVAELQRQQLGLVTRAQAIAAGLPANVVDGRLRRGRYRRLLPGVYADAGLPDSWEVAALAAALWAGGDAVLARDSAARVHRLPLPASRGEVLHLLVRTRCFDPRPGIVVHRTSTLEPHHVEAVDGLPVTTATRTVADLAATLQRTPLRRLVAAAVREGLTDALALRSMLRELGPVAGTRRLRALIDELSPLDAQCDSVLETDYLHMARRFGIEPTAMNHPVRDSNGDRRRLDVVYLPEHVWVELDSRKHHSCILDRNDDEDREDAVAAVAPWGRPLRFSWGDVHDRPAAVAAAVRAALAEARAAHQRTA